MSAEDLVVCATCGVERETADLPEVCPICADERQYVPETGQRWITIEELQRGPARLELVEREPGLWGLQPHDCIGIGQQAKIVQTEHGNLMIDVPAFIDDEVIEQVRALGPLRAIIPTHPHMFGLQTLWSQAFEDVPVLVSAPDGRWLGRRTEAVRLWRGECEPVPGVRLAQLGGHFFGSSVLLWPGADGAGVLLSGDTVAVSRDRSANFMRSYPNNIPLSGRVMRRIADALQGWKFERLYDNFTGCIPERADEVVQRSAVRNAEWAEGAHDLLTVPDPEGLRTPQLAGTVELRIAHPVMDLARAERFWVEGVGFEVLWRSGDSTIGGHRLLTVGQHGAGWHLELVEDPSSARTAPPSEEDLLVLYLGEDPDEEWLARIEECGGTQVASRNPYWDDSGVTYADPDGRRLVLTRRLWG